MEKLQMGEKWGKGQNGGENGGKFPKWGIFPPMGDTLRSLPPPNTKLPA